MSRYLRVKLIDATFKFDLLDTTGTFSTPEPHYYRWSAESIDDQVKFYVGGELAIGVNSDYLEYYKEENDETDNFLVAGIE